MADRVKVYEEKLPGVPVWAWLLPNATASGKADNRRVELFSQD